MQNRGIHWGFQQCVCGLVMTEENTQFQINWCLSAVADSCWKALGESGLMIFWQSCLIGAFIGSGLMIPTSSLKKDKTTTSCK